MKRKFTLLTAMIMLCICTLPGCADADSAVDSGIFNGRGWWFIMLAINFFVIITMLNFLRRMKKNLGQKPIASDEFMELCRKVIAQKIEKETETAEAPRAENV